MFPALLGKLTHSGVGLDDHPASQKEGFDCFRDDLRADAERGRQDVEPLPRSFQEPEVLLLHVVQAEVADAFDLACFVQVGDGDFLGTFGQGDSSGTLK